MLLDFVIFKYPLHFVLLSFNYTSVNYEKNQSMRNCFRKSRRRKDRKSFFRCPRVGRSRKSAKPDAIIGITLPLSVLYRSHVGRIAFHSFAPLCQRILCKINA